MPATLVPPTPAERPPADVPLPPGVDPDLFARAMLIRGVERRLLDLFAKGKLFGTVHTCIGQEWTGVALAQALRDGDVIFSNHRCHGHYLARTGDVDGLIAEVMGKQTGVCGGRGGSQHLCSQGFFSNGIQGGIVPVAAGLALAQKVAGGGRIAVVFVGDGTLGEGVVYETLNIASKWQLPLLVVLENNRYAQSTPQAQTLAGDIAARAEAFGIKALHSHTWDPARLLLDAANAAGYVRLTGTPLFLRVDTYRLMAHSKGDDDRDPQEVRHYWDIDPIARYARAHPREAERAQAALERRIDEAVARADAAPYPDPPPQPWGVTPNVSGSPTANAEARPLPEPCKQHGCCVQGEGNSSPAGPPLTWTPTRIPEPERAVHLIHAALRRNMRRDQRIVLLGEDIEGPYGGAFKVTKQLSQEFPGRVRNTPISEAALVGIGNGLALGGYLPVCEVMFGDFLTLAFDQLANHASKFRYMYNDQVRVPLVVRTPMGGKRGYGPTHSQSLEKHFLGLPDTLVLALHPRFDPGLVYDRLFANIDRPTLVIENKLLYGLRVTDEANPGFVLEHNDGLFPTTRLRPQAPPDLTILCYGGMLPEVEKAVDLLFELHDIVAEVVCPLQLYPFDPRPVVESLQSTNTLLVVEEGQAFAGLGAEAVAQVLERAPGVLRRCRRLAPPEQPIPSSGPLEKATLPGTDHVVRAALELSGHG